MEPPDDALPVSGFRGQGAGATGFRVWGLQGAGVLGFRVYVGFRVEGVTV